MTDQKYWKKGDIILGEVKTVHNYPHAAPLHNDRAAKSAGFKGGLVVNEYHFTQISHLLLELFGLDWLRYGEVDIKYLAPLFDGDTFLPKAKILGENPPGSGRLELDIWCENQHGERLARGRACCLVERE